MLSLALGWSTVSQAEEGGRQWRLGNDLDYEVYLDDSGALGVEQIAALGAESFIPQPGVLTLGYSRAVAWLRFEPPPLAPHQRWWWLEVAPSFLDQVDLYQHDGTGWTVRQVGDWRLFAERPIAHRHFIFPLDPDAPGPLLLRLQSTSSLVGMLTLWEPCAFVASATRGALIWGLHLGATGILAVAIALLALVFKQREMAAIALAGMINLATMVVVRGFHAEWLWPSQPLVASAAVGLVSFWAMASATWMMRELLTRGTPHRWFDSGLLVLIGVFAAAPLSLALDRFGETAMLLYVLHVLTALCALWLALGQVRQHGSVYAWAMLAAFVLYLVAIMPLVLMLLGLLERASPLISAWIIIMPVFLALSGVAQAWRLRQGFRAMAVARDQALAQARAAKHYLEGEVRERTTELMRAQERLQDALAFERRLRLEQGHLVDMLSHEFRNPLAIVDAAATNLVAVPPADGQDMRRRVEQIRRAVSSLAELITNYLNNHSLERDAFEAKLTNTPIAPLIDQVAGQVIASPRHNLVVDLSRAPASWCLDPFLIRMALNNLIDNAFKYAPPGGVWLEARTEGGTTAGAEARLALLVSDTGATTTTQDAERLFGKFQRGPRVSGIRGSGLGLFICRGIAQAHGGDIRLRLGEDSPRGGTTFAICLPPRDPD
ncbi:sensor histidine kinase [Thiorhodovibrio winogradskyi]|nr:7TM-DISM domain-containing protein [Thiorhodovibrio winogradskyi]